jgi:hypothetical protein
MIWRERPWTDGGSNLTVSWRDRWKPRETSDRIASGREPSEYKHKYQVLDQLALCHLKFCTVEWRYDWWMMTWEGHWRRWLWPHSCTTLPFAWPYGRKMQPSVGKSVVPTGIRPGRIWNASQKRYHVIHLARRVTCVSIFTSWLHVVYWFIPMLLR